MKRFVGKMLYFIGSGYANLINLCGRHHIVTAKWKLNQISKAMDLMAWAVVDLMEHLANVYELLKDSAVSLKVGPMFGDDLLIHIK